MKKVIIFFLMNLIFISVLGQNYGYKVNSVYFKYWDNNANKEVKRTDPQSVNLILSHDRVNDSLIWVSVPEKSYNAYKILPNTYENDTDAEGINRIAFVIDATNGRFTYVIIKVNFAKWLEDPNKYSPLIMMNPCDSSGNPKPSQSILKITYFGVYDILQYK